MPLFVVPAEGVALDDDLREPLRQPSARALPAACARRILETRPCRVR